MKPEAGDWPRAVLFDLDGTLIDSAPDIQEALNETLAAEGFARSFEAADIRAMVGGGVEVLVARAFHRLGHAPEAGAVARVAADFVARYEPRSTLKTRLLPGAEEALAAVARFGAVAGVVTNKPGAATRAILTHFGLERQMAVVIGGDAGPAKKPAPDLLWLACRTLSLAPGDCLFVGDSENDVNAAHAAAIPVAALKGGYTMLAPDDLGATFLLDDLGGLEHLFRKGSALGEG